MTRPQTLHSMRALHSRDSYGIHVRLLWSADDGRVAVAVADARTGDAFVIDLRDTDKPRDVFHHPCAYAACRAAETRVGECAAELVGLLAA